MRAARFLMLSILVCSIMGCAASQQSFGPSTGYGSVYAETAPAQAKLEDSLFKEDQAVISNEDMHRILTAKVPLPTNAKLAVVRFGQLPYWWGWSEDFVRVNKQIDSDFL